MSRTKIAIYGIGGLGADHRVFKSLTLKSEIIPVQWIEPIKNEKLDAYAKRLAQQIDVTVPFGLIGVSFGGMMATELNGLVHPKFTILISSASNSKELPRIASILRVFNCIHLLPNFLFKPPLFILNYMFSANNKRLLGEIIKDTDPNFIKWALAQIVKWEPNIEVQNIYRIHGSSDRIIPLKNKNTFIVEGGGHFMIVDKAKEISEHIQHILDKY